MCFKAINNIFLYKNQQIYCLSKKGIGIELFAPKNEDLKTLKISMFVFYMCNGATI